MSGLQSKIFGAALAAGLCAFGSAQAQTSKTLDAVRARGSLACGVSGNSAGFSLPDSQGVMRGIDADTCRTVATAVFGDPDKVKWVVLTPAQRFTALQSGEVDMVVANATWTLSRESRLGAQFASIYYYDGQAFMVKKSLGIKSAKELDNASICMLPGATSEVAAQEFFSGQKLKYTAITIEQGEELRKAFLAGRCDAYFTDASALAGFKASRGAEGDDLLILPDRLSAEPLGAAVRVGDERWFNIVRWTHFALITAEALGISSKSVDAALKSSDPRIRRFLGLEGDLGSSLGLDNAWTQAVVKANGNFGEIWDRNVKGVDRGLNRLASQGGLQYAPPFR